MSRKKKSIKEKVNELPIVADLKFRRFFSQGTPETFYIIEKFLELAISDNIKVTNITCQKHVFDSDQNENVTDLEIEAEGKEKVWIEMQRWNNKKEELSFFRWEKLRLTQLELHENEQCFLLVLYDTEDGSDELWQDFRDEEMAVYSMMSKKPLEKTNIYLFPVVANGVMIFLNLNKLSQRKDEIGEICHDLLAPGGVKLRNSAMEKRRKEAFTKKVVKEMCKYVRAICDEENEELIKKAENLALRNEDLAIKNEDLAIKAETLTNEYNMVKNQNADLIKILITEGFSDIEIASRANLSIEEVEAVRSTL